MTAFKTCFFSETFFKLCCRSFQIYFHPRVIHHASDWILLADLNKNYCFPVHIAFTQLRSDITIFSNSLRKVILIEVTCPCEENMESWYGTKINKYLALKTIVES